MRIEKAVQRILKAVQPNCAFSKPGIFGNEAVTVDHEERSEACDWISIIWNNFLTDPIIDEIAARFGIDGDDLMNTLEEVNFEIMEEAETTNIHGGTGDPDIHGKWIMNIYVPRRFWEADEKQRVRNILAHEVTHVADIKAKTIGEPTGGRGEDIDETIRAWLSSPDEREALQSQMLELIRFGYTKYQVVAGVFEQLGFNISPPMKQYLYHELELMYDDLKEEMASEYVYES